MAVPGLKAYVGGTYKDAKGVQAYVGSTWKPAKSVRVYKSGAWVPALFTSVTATQSSASVLAGATVTYTASPLIPSVVSAYEWWYMHQGQGSFTKWTPTTAVMTWDTTGGNGTTQWKCIVVQFDGTRVESNILSTVIQGRSTVTISGPKYVMSQGAGSTDSYRAGATFNITVGTPSVVTRVSFQLAYQSGGWVEYAAWTGGASQSYTMNFSSVGDWYAQAVITHADGVTVASSYIYLACLSFSIATTASPTNPIVYQGTVLSAGMSPGAPGDFPNTPKQWQYSREGAAWVWWTGVPNGYTWVPQDTAWHDFRWLEGFPDGSTIVSVPVRVNTRPIQEIVASDNWYKGVSGGTGLENAMWEARANNVPLRITGSWGLAKNHIWIPDGLTITAHGAGFSSDGTARFRNGGVWPGHQTSEAGREMPAGTGGYGGGTFSWAGGTFDGNGNGIFTLSHSPGFTIRDAIFYHWCTSTNPGHAIECNSSGGADNGSGEYGTYNVNILSNCFGGVTSQRSNSNDEAVHYDWAWPGSGVKGQTDSTMCHNVKVEGNTFHQQWGGGEFTKCAIGGHDPSGSLRPTNRHNHFTIRSNEIHGSLGSTGTSPDKGAIHNYWIRSSWIVFNNLYGCTPARLITCELPAEANAGGPYYNALGANASNAGGNPNVYGTAG